VLERRVAAIATGSDSPERRCRGMLVLYANFRIRTLGRVCQRPFIRIVSICHRTAI
jgi:hypothetical protein